jgi:conjugative relaxase-like TrwC/TraI family protein
MLSVASVASVGSSAGAANYFAKDDYYTVEGSSEISEWGGAGAFEVGLSGHVGKQAFEGVLNGVLPSGEAVAQYQNRRHGLDLTFSLPKSASVMAYIGGDQRILEANLAAVKQTMAWVEKNLAEHRKDIEGRSVPVRSGNLIYALFQHDTSRALDPQGHVHAVIANLTRTAEGKWVALHADKLWSNNSVIGSIYHAYLRQGLKQLGYRIEPRGKHGTFEIDGVPRAVIEAFSQRREQILDHATRLGVKSPEALREITKRSRDPKLNADDRDALRASWRERATALGFNAKVLADAALARSQHSQPMSALERGYRAVSEAIAGARERLGALLRGDDPLVDRGLARVTQSPDTARTQLAVASAVRILSEREAAFPASKIAKTALDLGLSGVTIDKVDDRIAQLVRRGALLQGEGRASDHVMTREALRTEERILAMVEAGKGTSRPVIDAADAPARLQAATDRELNAGQLGAATLILTSPDRTVTVQGIAGAGKSTMLDAVGRVAESEGRTVRGLAFQNKMVEDLRVGAGIETQTIASFVLANERFVTERDSDRFDAARARFEGTMLVVDETSMVSSSDMLKLHEIADALGVDKLVLVGDRQQLSSINAGKSFAMIQAAGGTMARMDENIRQRTDQLRTVAALANLGKASAAMKVLGDNVIEAARPAEHAADMWLALSTAEREATAVFASGREARATINLAIQNGLASEGSLSGSSVRLTVYDRVNTTREELRYAATYRAGQVLEVGRGGADDVGLRGGRYDVLKVHPNGKVELADGRRKLRFDPQNLSPTETRDRLQLNGRKEIELRAGDRIRWTANDKERGLLNAAIARIIGIDARGVTVETAGKGQLTLAIGDPMLSRVDLAYALNMHMAQGITTDKAIAVMDSHERNLSNQRLFNVGVTRVRDELKMVVDDREKLARQLDHNPGDKTSALEALGRLDVDRKQITRDEKFDGGPIGDLPGLPPVPSDLQQVSSADSKAHAGAAAKSDLGAPADLKREKVDLLPPLPERSLGLDL